jgi:pimeloyl-ACP methyl ester carboxylesterase
LSVNPDLPVRSPNSRSIGQPLSDNPDFVDVVIQSYRHRYGNAPGDPAYDASEAKLAVQPPISVPTIVLHGEADGVGPAAGSEGHSRHFTKS